jgi:hypothetical protein
MSLTRFEQIREYVCIFLTNLDPSYKEKFTSLPRHIQDVCIIELIKVFVGNSELKKAIRASDIDGIYALCCDRLNDGILGEELNKEIKTVIGKMKEMEPNEKIKIRNDAYRLYLVVNL